MSRFPGVAGHLWWEPSSLYLLSWDLSGGRQCCAVCASAGLWCVWTFLPALCGCLVQQPSLIPQASWRICCLTLQIRVATGPAIIKPKEDKERRGWLASRRLIMFSTSRMEIKLRMEILKYIFIKFSYLYIYI